MLAHLHVANNPLRNETRKMLGICRDEKYVEIIGDAISNCDECSRGPSQDMNALVSSAPRIGWTIISLLKMLFVFFLLL